MCNREAFHPTDEQIYMVKYHSSVSDRRWIFTPFLNNKIRIEWPILYWWNGFVHGFSGRDQAWSYFNGKVSSVMLKKEMNN